MKRTKPPTRKGQLKRSAPKPHRGKEQPGRPEAMRRFRETVCGAVDSPLEAHHCLKASWLKRYADRNRLTGPEYWAVVLDPRVAIPLDHRTHEKHTNRVAVICGRDLPVSVHRATEEYGPEAVAALLREHPLMCESCDDTGIETGDHIVSGHGGDMLSAFERPCSECEEWR